MTKLFEGLIIPFLFLIFMVKQYSIVQTYHYELNKYFKYETSKLFVIQTSLIVLFAISFFVDKNLKKLILIGSFCLNLSYINKTNLKFTNRVKRYLYIYYLFVFLIYWLIPFNKTTSFMLINNFLIMHMVIIHLLSLIIEKLIMRYYLKDARKIIKNIKVIGITGSYGKTSCKNIIYDMLKELFNVSKTPKSYNTQIGIIKSIRENVDRLDDYFICEYGVDKKGGMDKLLKIAKPNISLITEIGTQHMLTFKNIINIKNEKIKLAKILKENEIAIINNDNKYLREEIKKLKCNVITYGVENCSDIMAKNIIVNDKGSSFDLYVGGEKIKRIDICLLGKHSILNVLGAIGVLKSLDVELSNIDFLIKKIKPIEHRLQLKIINGIKVIDDSFNSNEQGFKNAIDVLNNMKYEKIIITPGIIEQGNNSEKINFELGEYMVGKVDKVILVEKNSSMIKKGLLNKGFNEDKILIRKNFLEAWEIIKSLKNKENKIILIENDLPDIYLK